MCLADTNCSHPFRAVLGRLSAQRNSLDYNKMMRYKLGRKTKHHLQNILQQMRTDVINGVYDLA